MSLISKALREAFHGARINRQYLSVLSFLRLSDLVEGPMKQRDIMFAALVLVTTLSLVLNSCT